MQHDATRQHGKKLSPWEMYTNEPYPWKPTDFQVFGSPVYVLDKDLQDSNSPGKWISRSRVGVYIGHSLIHSGNVVLVLNPETYHVSPQYHVVFDNGFTTVGRTIAATKEAMDKQFQKLFTSERWNFSDKFEDNVTRRHHFDSAWSADDDPDQVVESVEPHHKSHKPTKQKHNKPTKAPQRRRGARHILSESPTRERRLRRVRFSEGDALTQSFAVGTDHPPEHGSQALMETFPDMNKEFSTITAAQSTKNSNN